MDSGSLNGLSDIYGQYADIYGQSTNNANNIKNKLENIDYATSGDDELLEACKEFESYFVEQVFKALQKMVPENEESDSKYMDMFGDTLIQEYAKSATNQGDGFGIANMLYEQMKRNYGMDVVNSEDMEAMAGSANVKKTEEAE